jgi:hypothetical protein
MENLGMRTNSCLWTIAPLLLGFGSLTFSSVGRAQEIAPQKQRDAVRVAKSFLAGLEPAEKCPLEVEADPDEALGILIRGDTLPLFLFVPQKGLAANGLEAEEQHEAYGVPLGYLFTGTLGTPLVDDKFVDWHTMRHTVYHHPKAGKLYFNCLVLTVGRKSDGSHAVHVFGTGEKPLFSVPVKTVDAAETAISVKDFDVQALRLKLELSFGKSRRASIPFGGQPHP